MPSIRIWIPITCLLQAIHTEGMMDDKDEQDGMMNGGMMGEDMMEDGMMDQMEPMEPMDVPDFCKTEDFADSDNFYGALRYEPTKYTPFMPFNNDADDVIVAYTSTQTNIFQACRVKCLNTAGCYSYYIDRQLNCHSVMGAYTQGPRSMNVYDSGKLCATCDNQHALSTSFHKITEFSCKFQTTKGASELIDALNAQNGAGTDAPLNQWIVTMGANAKSQFVALKTSSRHVDGNDWTWVDFVIKTFTRTARSVRSKRSALYKYDKDDKDDMMDGDKLEIEDHMDVHRWWMVNYDRDPNRADKQIVEDVLTGLNLPDGVTVAETTEPKTTRLTQLNQAGQFVADCVWRWNGRKWLTDCKCNKGFAPNENGVGCKPSYEESKCMVGSFSVLNTVDFSDATNKEGVSSVSCEVGEVCQTVMTKDMDGRRHYEGACMPKADCEANAQEKKGDRCRILRKQRKYMSQCSSTNGLTVTTTTCLTL